GHRRSCSTSGSTGRRGTGAPSTVRGIRRCAGSGSARARRRRSGGRRGLRRCPRSSGVEHTIAPAAVYSGAVSAIDGSELAGRVAIVTGGGQGIGRATALELARLGADVVIAELNAEGAERTAKEVRGLGRKAFALPTDVTKRSDLGTM